MYKFLDCLFGALLFVGTSAAIAAEAPGKLNYALSRTNIGAGSSTIQGSVGQAITNELSGNTAALGEWIVPKEISGENIQRLLGQNSQAIASLTPSGEFIQHFLIEEVIESEDQKEAVARVACLFLPSLRDAIQPQQQAKVAASYTRYYALKHTETGWVISIQASEPLLTKLFANDSFARRVFFFFPPKQLPPEGEQLNAISEALLQTIAKFAAFSKSDFWSSFELFCEPVPLTQLKCPQNSPESAVVEYMKGQKEGNLDLVNSLLVESARLRNERMIQEVGKPGASNLMKKMYAKFGDSFCLFVKGHPAKWTADKTLVTSAGVGITERWQPSYFTVTQLDNSRYSLLPKIEDKAMSDVIDAKFGDIFPLWLSELNFKKCLLHLPL